MRNTYWFFLFLFCCLFGIGVLTYFKILVFTTHYSISSIVSLILLGLNFLLVFMNYKQFEYRLSFDRRKQASKIGAWLYDTGNIKPVGARLIGECRLQNASDVPVYNVYVFSGANKDSRALSKMSFDPNEVIKIGVLPPGINNISIEVARGEMFTFPRVAILFTDSRSNHWFRNISGELTEVSIDEFNKIRSKLNEPCNEVSF